MFLVVDDSCAGFSPSAAGRGQKQYTLSSTSKDEDESDDRLEARMAAQEGMLGPVVS